MTRNPSNPKNLRSTCVICGKKRYREKMTKVFGISWACTQSEYVFENPCKNHPDIAIMRHILELESDLKVLSLSYIAKTGMFKLLK